MPLYLLIPVLFVAFVGGQKLFRSNAGSVPYLAFVFVALVLTAGFVWRTATALLTSGSLVGLAVAAGIVWLIAALAKSDR